MSCRFHDVCLPGFERSYCGAPMVSSDGHRLGTLYAPALSSSSAPPAVSCSLHGRACTFHMIRFLTLLGVGNNRWPFWHTCVQCCKVSCVVSNAALLDSLTGGEGLWCKRGGCRQTFRKGQSLWERATRLSRREGGPLAPAVRPPQGHWPLKQVDSLRGCCVARKRSETGCFEVSVEGRKWETGWGSPPACLGGTDVFGYAREELRC